MTTPIDFQAKILRNMKEKLWPERQIYREDTRLDGFSSIVLRQDEFSAD